MIQIQPPNSIPSLNPRSSHISGASCPTMGNRRSEKEKKTKPSQCELKKCRETMSNEADRSDSNGMERVHFYYRFQLRGDLFFDDIS